MSSEYLLVLVLYILLLCDIWNLIRTKIQATKAEKPLPVSKKQFKPKHPQYKLGLSDDDAGEMFDSAGAINDSIFVPEKLIEESVVVSNHRKSTTVSPQKIIEDQWEAKRVRSRKVSRAYKGPPTASQLLARAIADDSGEITSVFGTNGMITEMTDEAIDFN